MPNLNYTLFDPQHTDHLLPLAYTRAVAEFRVGIFTIREKWARQLDTHPQILTRDYLQALYPQKGDPSALQCYINGALLPDAELIEGIHQLKNGESLVAGDLLLALVTDKKADDLGSLFKIMGNERKYSGSVTAIRRNWDIFHLNGEAIRADIPLSGCYPGKGDTGRALQVRNPGEVYIDEGAVIEAAIIDAENGPVYIGKYARIMDGAMLKGPVSIGSHAVVKMGAKIYPDTTIGPYCKVGGEVSNSVLFAYSNKGHDGYLGNSVLGEWCNLGADTNTSNLKNNYSTIKCWDAAANAMVDTGLQFCGLIMGDHAKSGINTMFNTGTVAGVAANIFGGGFPPKFISSFSWGGKDGFTEFQLEKAFEMAARMMERRHLDFTDLHRAVLTHVFKSSAPIRSAN